MRGASFLDPILQAELVAILGPTERHETVLRSTLKELGNPSGNLLYDVSTAVIMREHGIKEIMTADTDFRKIPFLTVTNPVSHDT